MGASIGIVKSFPQDKHCAPCTAPGTIRRAVSIARRTTELHDESTWGERELGRQRLIAEMVASNSTLSKALSRNGVFGYRGVHRACVAPTRKYKGHIKLH